MSWRSDLEAPVESACGKQLQEELPHCGSTAIELLSVSRKAVFREQRDCRLADSSDDKPAQLGFRIVLSVPAQRQRLWLESQACLPDLSGTGTEPAHQAEEAAGAREAREPLSEPTALNQVWSMDFMHDRLSDGRSIRLFNVIDDFDPEPPDEVCNLYGGFVNGRLPFSKFWPRTAVRPKQTFHNEMCNGCFTQNSVHALPWQD
jgi:hypothetical protein